MYLDQGPKLRLIGRQCNQKLSVGDQNSKTGRQQAIIHLSPWHLKFQGKRAFLKRKQKTPVDNCSKIYDLHIYQAPFSSSGFSQYGYRGRKRVRAIKKC